MREEANIYQLKDLYEIANKIKELKPWRYLNEIELVTILLPNKEEPIYCSIMGKEGDTYGIAIYDGFRAVRGYFNIIKSEKIPSSQLIRYENSIVIYFTNKKRLKSEDIEIIDKLGYKFEGKNDWIYARSLKKGFAPYKLDRYEVIETTEILEQLFLCIKEYFSENKEFSIMNGESIFRWYNKQKFIWENFKSELFIPENTDSNVILNEARILKKLINKNRVNTDLELDIVYLESVVNDKEFETPIIPRLCLLADHHTGIVLDQRLLTPSNDDIQEVFGVIINYMKEIGRPLCVYIRDEYIKKILHYLCKKLNIELIISEELIAIDTVCKGLFAEGY